MKERIKKFINTKEELYLVLALTLMLGFHIYQFIDSGFQVYPLIRIIAYGTAIPLLIFIGKTTLPYTLFPFAIALSQTISFENYTPFILVYICSRMKKKLSIPMFIVYALSVVAICVRHDKSVVHYLLHICGCCVLYFLLSLFIEHIKKESKLDLTEDEKYILEEIAYNNKELKEFDQWKANTVSKKLTKCCRKNNCANPKELISRYRKMKES